jgi:hypothetical protein
MLVHAYNPRYWGGGKVGGLWFEASSGKKVSKTYLKNKSGVMVLVCNVNYLQLWSKTGPGKSLRHYLKKNTKAKELGVLFKW